LDPEGIYSDDALWEALDEVNMKETIKYMSGQLGRSFSLNVLLVSKTVKLMMFR